MRAYVFTDPSLVQRAGQFVWLEINTELAKNAPVQKQLKIPALPSFFVLDPATERVAIRWTGGATVPQLHKLLDTGAATVRGGASGEVARLLSKADSLYAAADYKAAAPAYEAALGASPSKWPAYSRAVDALLFSLSENGDDEKIVAVAKEAYPRLGRSVSALGAAGSGLSSALALKADHPGRAEAIAFFEPKLAELVRDRSIVAAADDRSSSYFTLADARQDAKDEAGVKKVYEEMATFLEGEAAKAKTPEERSVFDPHRLSAYLALNQPERAVPMLQQSEKDFPDDYNPPQRLATALNAMKHYDEALAESDKAMALAYGPRKFRLIQTRTDIYLGKADTASARSTLEDGIHHLEGLPDGQRSEGALGALRKRLTGLGGTPPAGGSH